VKAKKTAIHRRTGEAAPVKIPVCGKSATKIGLS